MKHGGGEQVEIVLRALPDDVPFAVRLRSALKFALRGCRLRCLRVIDVPAFRERPAKAEIVALRRSPAKSEQSREAGHDRYQRRARRDLDDAWGRLLELAPREERHGELYVGRSDPNE